MHCNKIGSFNGIVVVVSNLRHQFSPVTILAQLASDEVLDSAYEWLCRRRRDYSANSDVWSFRRCWPREKAQIKAELQSGSYRFSLLSASHDRGTVSDRGDRQKFRFGSSECRPYNASRPLDHSTQHGDSVPGSRCELGCVPLRHR